AEAEGDDGQVVAAQAQYREAEDEAEEGRHQAGDRQADPEAQAVVVRQQRVTVGPHGVEADVTQIEQAGQADHDVQAEAEHHVDQDQRGDVHRAAAAEEGPGQGNHHQRENDPALGRGQGKEVAGPARQSRYAGRLAPGGRETVTQQLPAEHEHGHGGDGPQHGWAGAMHFQLDADHRELEAEYRIGHGQHQQCAEKGGLEIAAHHTFSTSGRPRMPVGRNSSTSTRRLKATTSLYWSPKRSAPKASAMPSSRPPSMAPGMLPIPPSTAAVNALMPARKPMCGLITPYCRPSSTAATAARVAPMTKVRAMVLLVLMPSRLAIRMSSAQARQARPRRDLEMNRVRPYITAMVTMKNSTCM